MEQSIIIMEIKDNTFARQFETTVEQGLFQLNIFSGRKNIFDKINTPDQFDNEEFVSQFLSEIMAIAIERKLKVVQYFQK
jgi:hypothetical protein